MSYPTFGDVPANFALPVLSMILVDQSVGTTLANGASTNVDITYTAPFVGYAALYGQVRAHTATAGIQTCASVFRQLNGGDLISQPTSTLRTEGGSGLFTFALPILGYWWVLAPGSNTVRLSVVNGTGGISTVVDRVQGVLFSSVAGNSPAGPPVILP